MRKFADGLHSDRDAVVAGPSSTWSSGQVEGQVHAYAEVAYRFGADALLNSHLPMLDLVDMLARDYEAWIRPTLASPVSDMPFACSPSPTPSNPITGRSGDHRTWSK